MINKLWENFTGQPQISDDRRQTTDDRRQTTDDTQTKQQLPSGRESTGDR